MGGKWVWAFLAVLILAVAAVVCFGIFYGSGIIPVNTTDNSSGVLPGNETNTSITPGNSSSNSTNNQSGSGENATANHGLDAETKLRAERLTSLFENDNIELQYGYAENLGDGRGITCGRAGFCTGCGDAYEVVRLYDKKNPGNVLSGYLPELERLNIADDSSDTSGLEGFIEDWKYAANDPLFRESQDEISDKLCYNPAMDYADMIELKSNLAKAILYDTIIQHGNGDDPDSMIALLNRAEEGAGGTPKSGIDEATWLKKFLEVRRADLAHAYGEETRDEWAQSVSRVDVFSEILNAGNLELNGPIKIMAEDYRGRTIP